MPFPVRVPWPAPLVEGRLLGRRNRFLADIELPGGRVATAHCVNTGRMEALVIRGARAWVSHHPGGGRALEWTWRMVEEDGVLVGCDTSMPNRIVAACIEARAVPGLAAWRAFRAEARYGERSRVDFLLEERGGRPHFVEVKNCHLAYPDGRGYFPDSVSERATGHLRELAREAAAGARATVLFTAQRADIRAIRPSDLHDPAFAGAAREAAAAGVRFRAISCAPTLGGIEVRGTLPVELKPYRLERHRRWFEERRATSGWSRRAEPFPLLDAAP
ncbi:MAG: DNA/RNA nuclease SfsA [Candidatus Sumerlaeia bacterium]|nr:DNA/RNA nuclease SfsA [Candidatus Sumerlaeia bacterium]